MPAVEFTAFKRELELAFQPRDFQAMWFVLNNKYSSLGFHDDISDGIRIQEYKYIVQQLRKYMASKKDVILYDCSSPEDMSDVINHLIGNGSEYAEERKEIVYNFVRDDWLMELRGYVATFIFEHDDAEEEDE